VDWWIFAEGTEADARDYLARFLDDGAAGIEATRAEAKAAGVEADFSLASVSEMLCWLGTQVQLVEAAPPDGVPDWVQAVVTEHGGGFRDFAEASRSHVLRAAFYLGESLVTTYPVLRWDVGAADRPEVHQPVVTGFASGDDLAVLGAAESALAGGDVSSALSRWRKAVSG
jgi:hypothetical protein